MKLLDVNVAWIRPPATWDLLLGSQTLNMETRWRLRDIGVELSWEELDRSQALLNHMLSRYQQVFQILLVLDFLNFVISYAYPNFSSVSFAL